MAFDNHRKVYGSVLYDAYGNSIIIDNEGALITRTDRVKGYISDDNSSTTPLVANDIFEGIGLDVLNFASITVFVYSDVGSATDGLSVQWSTNGIDWDETDDYTIRPGDGKTFSFGPAARYMRVVYTNGSSPQSAFRLQTMCHPIVTKPSSHKLFEQMHDDNDAQLVKSVLTARNSTDGHYYNLEVDDNNNLKTTTSITFGGSSSGSGSVSSLKYERMDEHDLPKESQGFDVVHTITGPAVFYKMLFEVDSDHIYIQVTIDGDDVFPAGDGFKLEELEDMQLGTGGNSGYYSYGGSGNSTGNFDIFQYAPNRWVWGPPDPLHIDTSLQVKMKSSNNNKHRDLESGIIVWRAL